MRMERHNLQRIRTPEGITFSMPLAGLTSRFLARLLDWCVIGALLLAIVVICLMFGIAGGFIGLAALDLVAALFLVGVFLITLGYNVLCEYFWNGQTVGKKICKLRVMDELGLRLQFKQVVIRNLLRPADFLPIFYQLGALMLVLHSRNQRLGDLAAGTIVVRREKRQQPDLTSLFVDKFNSFRCHPHLVARLRQQVSARESKLALEALLRRNQLEPEARARVFHEFAELFRRKVRFPIEATRGLSDENYVRNVVDIMLRERDAKANREKAA